MSSGVPVLKKKLSKLADSGDGFPEHFVPAYLILFDRNAKMYRCYHADMEDLVVLDDDPVAALSSLIDIISLEVNTNEDERYN